MCFFCGLCYTYIFKRFKRESNKRDLSRSKKTKREERKNPF